jgi:AraC-like DNA-binding protein
MRRGCGSGCAGGPHSAVSRRCGHRARPCHRVFGCPGRWNCSSTRHPASTAVPNATRLYHRGSGPSRAEHAGILMVPPESRIDGGMQRARAGGHRLRRRTTGARHDGEMGIRDARSPRQHAGLGTHPSTGHERTDSQETNQGSHGRFSGDPIADVAFAVGYADQAHTTREMRRWFGVTPAAMGRGAPFYGDLVAAPGAFASGAASGQGSSQSDSRKYGLNSAEGSMSW